MLTPNWTREGRLLLSKLAVANPLRDGTGALVQLAAGIVGGLRINAIDITPEGAVAAGVVRLFLRNGVNTPQLWREIHVPACAPSAVEAAYTIPVAIDNFQLPDGFSLHGSTHNADLFGIVVHAADHQAP